jgi:hypothetical protein
MNQTFSSFTLSFFPHYTLEESFVKLKKLAAPFRGVSPPCPPLGCVIVRKRNVRSKIVERPILAVGQTDYDQIVMIAFLDSRHCASILASRITLPRHNITNHKPIISNHTFHRHLSTFGYRSNHASRIHYVSAKSSEKKEENR